MSNFPDAIILDIDLGEMKIEKKTIKSDVYRLYPGGSALGAYILNRDMKPGTDALSPDNIMAFCVSPLVGLPVAGANRMSITAKSPLTGAIGDSQAGGFFPMQIKANGWDAIVVRGRASHPAYIHIDGDKAEIRDASNIWGMVTGEAQKEIKAENGEDVEIAQIGPAGENLVRFACVLNMSNRANGRGGMGAVMGSKNLKAIAIQKKRALKPFDEKGFYEFAKKLSSDIENSRNYMGMRQDGTDRGLSWINRQGYLPTRNWTSGCLGEEAEKITGSEFTKKILIRRDTCFACPVRCKRVVEVPGDVDPVYGGPEYESVAALGAYCGITDMEDIARANQLCNMYGMDTISCGATIAFAMECYENGIIGREDTGGLELEFGDSKLLLLLIDLIANREGFGDMLAKGSKSMSDEIGKGSDQLLTTVKGQEMPAHMPQWKAALGLIYAVNPFGADHQSSSHDHSLCADEGSSIRTNLAKIGVHKGSCDFTSLEYEKVRFAFNTQCFVSAVDTLCMCQFIAGCSYQMLGPSEIAELCRLGVGWDTSVYELMLIGERRINTMRHFNSREGFSRSDDKLPGKIYKELSGGPSEGAKLDEQEIERAKDFYYELAGWEIDTGNPTKALLRRLSIEE